MDDFPAPQFPHKMSTSGALSLVAMQGSGAVHTQPFCAVLAKFAVPCWRVDSKNTERCAWIYPHVCVTRGGKVRRLSRLSTWQAAVGGSRPARAAAGVLCGRLVEASIPPQRSG